MPLTDKQQEALEIMKSGKNIFLTGVAGSGKSFLLKKYIEDIRLQKKNVIICAPTGIAALNIGGMTLHRAFHAATTPLELGMMKKPSAALIAADVIVIDEISMCRLDLFSFAMRMIHYAEEESKDRSNIKRHTYGHYPKQVIVVGDFCQLPPVVKRKDKNILDKIFEKDIKEGYAFYSDEWELADFKTVVLTEIIRQSDIDFICALNQVRRGDLAGIEWIKRNSLIEYIDNAIFLCATKKDAEEENMRRLKLLLTPEYTFNAETSGSLIGFDCPAEQVLRLRIGARVMILINDTLRNLYVNGSMGNIVSINENVINVKLDNGNVVPITRYTWENIEYILKNKKVEPHPIGIFSQFPVKVAYAITIHKAQGLTFDRVNLNPESFFAPGQLYVALSRITSVKGLHLTQPFMEKSLIISLNVIKFYEHIMPISMSYAVVNLPMDIELSHIEIKSMCASNSFDKEQEDITDYSYNGGNKKERKKEKVKIESKELLIILMAFMILYLVLFR